MILFQNDLVDKKDVSVDIEDRGYQFGDGVYEVIKVYGGKFFGLEEHLTRLVRSCNEISLPLPYSIDQLGANLHSLLAQNRLRDGHVYMQITRGVAPRTHQFPGVVRPVLVAYTKESSRPLQAIEAGISAILTDDIRWLRCDIKSLNLLGNVLAKQKAKEAGCVEAILHRSGVVTEGSSSNVFIVQDGAAITHPADNLILNGITREVVLRMAQARDIRVIERPVTVNELLSADEVFITSTTQEISPVIEIDGQPVGAGTPGPVTRALQGKFEELIGLL